MFCILTVAVSKLLKSNAFMMMYSYRKKYHINYKLCVFCILAGEKPYKCSIPQCNKAFAQLSNLQHHQRNHDNNKAKSSRKSFYCTVCQRGFVTESSLDKHIARVSTTFYCTVCQRGFVTESSLDKHIARVNKFLKSNDLPKGTSSSDLLLKRILVCAEVS
jgi:uncharacterized Zn-finger protein